MHFGSVMEVVAVLLLSLQGRADQRATYATQIHMTKEFVSGPPNKKSPNPYSEVELSFFLQK